MYKVVYENHIRRFEDECDRMLREGWKPLGGISVNEGIWFAQAFVRGDYNAIQ